MPWSKSTHLHPPPLLPSLTHCARSAGASRKTPPSKPSRHQTQRKTELAHDMTHLHRGESSGTDRRAMGSSRRLRTSLWIARDPPLQPVHNHHSVAAIKHQLAARCSRLNQLGPPVHKSTTSCSAALRTHGASRRPRGLGQEASPLMGQGGHAGMLGATSTWAWSARSHIITT